MAIRIERIETRIYNHPIRPERVVISPGGCHDTSRFLIVTLYGENGLIGYGEAATVPLWSGESAETAQWMVEQLFGPRLLKATFDHPREALAIMDSATWSNPFAKSAVDTAIWDMWAKSKGVSAMKLFADREPVRAIPTRASIGSYPIERSLSLARAFWEEGIRTLKFKAGLNGIDDIGRLRAVRQELGEEPVFTLDYNGAFRNADDAVRSIEALLPFRPTIVEQPTHRHRIGLLAEVRRRVSVPIMADECIFTSDHLAEAIDRDAFDILSIYPGKNGGFTRAIGMAQTAQKAGKACAIGSNLETDIGQAAMACLAAGLSAFPVEKVDCDLPSALYYERSSVTNPLPIREGCLVVPIGPGFGVEPVA